MRIQLMQSIVALSAFFWVTSNDTGNAQDSLERIAIKNGETIEMRSVYRVVQCKSILIGIPEVEILEGPSQVTLSIREEPVLPRRQGCAEKVPGGTLLLSAKDVTQPLEAKLTYRVKYKTKDGSRQRSDSYIVSLFP
jgi:hypothetical protein